MPVRITVVTPSFNQARFLEETLQSVTSQRQYVHEYFVVDGGSTDGSVDLIKKYTDKIDWWTSEKDRGQSDAIHRGFARATGDYLSWLNSDDVLLPGALAEVTDALERHPEWDAVTGYHVRTDEESRIISMHRIPGESASAARRGVHHVIQQTCVFRRSVYEKVGGLNLSLHCVMDTELWCRMWQAGTVWGHIPRYQAAFRQHAKAKGSDAQWQAMYRREEQSLRENFPEFCAPTFKHQLGLLGYRAGQIISGRHPRAMLETRRFRGRRVSEVPAFGR